jgi:tetratricopeptide (TPR) repeat protein
MQDQSVLSVLIIDPSPSMRANLQGMLAQASLSQIDYAASAAAAIRLLSGKSFDIILCEYDLGDDTNGQNGQQLLEDLRHNKLIGGRTIFIMLTSEAIDSRVLGAAELTPTDYVLKPFTVELLSVRIARAVARRATFLPVYQLIEQGRLQEAIDACAAAESTDARNAAQFSRLRAETCLVLGDAGQAGQIYEAALAKRPLDWAQFGLARSLFERQRFEEACTGLEALIERNPRFMAAYDLLAKAHMALGQNSVAQTILEDAVSMSPHLVQRLRHLGGVAMQTGDSGVAERAFRQVVTKARHSEFRDPEDHLNLVKVLVKKGDAVQAGGVIREMERSVRGNPNAEACRAIGAGLLHELGGNSGGAADQFSVAADAVGASKGLSSQLRVGLMHNCLDHKLDQAASDVALNLMNDADSAMTMEQATRMFESAGRQDLAQGLGTQVGLQVQAMMRDAAEKSDKGEYRAAVAVLSRAVRKAPNNVALLLVSAQAILRQLNAFGWEAALGEQAREQMQTAARLEPGQPELNALREEYAATQVKYGIAV